MNQVLIIPDRDHLEKSIELANTYGVGFEYNDFFKPDLMNHADNLQAVITKYCNAKLPSYTTMHGVFYDISVFSVDPDIRTVSKNRVMESLLTAKRMGVKGVVFHTNINPMLTSSEYRNHWLTSNAEFFEKAALQYPDIDIYMENMFDAAPFDMKLLAQKMKHVQNFGLCLDYAHATISPTDIHIWLEELSPFIRHVHINDNDKKDDLHLAIGKGSIDWNEFEELRKIYLSNQSILVETSKYEDQVASLQYLRKNRIIFNE